MRDSVSFSGALLNEKKNRPGILILTDLRIIFLPYRNRSELLMRRRFARLDDTGLGRITPLNLIRRASIESDDGEEKDLCVSILDHGESSISVDEFLDFMGANACDISSVKDSTLQISVGSVNVIDYAPMLDSDGTYQASTFSSLTSDSSYFELINVSVPSFEDITTKWDNFDYSKLYKLDYKFEDYKFEYRVYIIQIEVGDVNWTVRRRYSSFEALHAALSARLTQLQLPDLPPKTPSIESWPLFSSQGYTSFLCDRQEKLETFLKTLVRLQEAWEQGCLLQRFLDDTQDLEMCEKISDYLAKRSQAVSDSSDNLVPLKIGSPSDPVAIDTDNSLARSILDIRDLLRNGGLRPQFDASEEIPDSTHRELLTISTNCGGEYTFEVGGNAETAVVESRYSVDGSLSNAEWCARFQDEVKQLCARDEFAAVVSRSPALIQGKSRPFSLLAEYCRLGVPDENWTICDVNANYECIPSYPHILILPTLTVEGSVDSLLSVISQRSRGRIPSLTWIHPRTKAPLCRSSQPMSGLGNILEEDNELLKAIRATTQCAGGKLMRIIDARPKLNARANSYIGKGYEDLSRLGKEFQIHFIGIENCHKMRQSLDVLRDAIAHGHDASINSANSYDSLLNASGWLSHGRIILEGANFVVSCLEAGDAVLVHCSDGWDRTSQLCAIAQLLLDPYYRTIVGFRALIEKDFCSFGHLFDSRLRSALTDERSPIFLQFLDVCWHVMEQFPSAFEFTETYLILIADGVYSRGFSTFLGNSEQERMEVRIPDESSSAAIHGTVEAALASTIDESMGTSESDMPTPIVSIWSYIDCFFHTKIHNPSYCAPKASADSTSTSRFLKPVVDPRNWPLWGSYFLRGSSCCPASKSKR